MLIYWWFSLSRRWAPWVSRLCLVHRYKLSIWCRTWALVGGQWMFFEEWINERVNEFFLSGSSKPSIMIFSWAKYLLPIMDFCNSAVKTVTITCRLSRLYCIITWRLSSQHLLVDRQNLGASLDFSPWRFSLKYLSYAQHVKSPHETQKSPNSSSIL